MSILRKKEKRIVPEVMTRKQSKQGEVKAKLMIKETRRRKKKNYDGIQKKLTRKGKTWKRQEVKGKH